MIILLVLFTVIAWVVFRNARNPEVVRVNLVAQQYGDAWRDGSLDKIEYDPLSAPETASDPSKPQAAGDPGKVRDNVAWITHSLDPTGTLKPVSVQSREDSVILDPNGAVAHVTLDVTWVLQRTGLSNQGQTWRYPVLLDERKGSDGRWRVAWMPRSVHPQIVHGLVLVKHRVLAPRATILGAGDTPLPPAKQSTLAQAVLGSVTAAANGTQAALAPGRGAVGDRIGLSGMQGQFDSRLAGLASVEVRAERAQGYIGVEPVIAPVFVGPPEAPKPLQLTLDARTQQRAEAALAGVRTPAALVVVKPSTGELIAVANNDPANDLGLGAQQPPGALMGLTTGLALLRSGQDNLNTRVDCSAPWTYQEQLFRNAQGPAIPGVTLGAAIEGGCTTGIAREHAKVSPGDVEKAAYDLGLAAPDPRDPTTTTTNSDAPNVDAVGDQLGIPAFQGLVPVDADPLHHAENLSGEGKILVSPLSVTRATATVATGARQSVRFVVNPPAKTADVTKALSPQEVASLQDLMARSVTEQGGTAHGLVNVGGETPHAMAATSGYGTGASTTRTAWCTGYRGDYAFTALVTQAPAAQGVSPAVNAVASFLRQTG
jgi:hypothetical protein